jgi:Protein of unknown function (DUF3684)
MGFAVVRSDIKDEALTKLRIARHPSAASVTAVLLQNPPTSQDQARKIFEYLTNLLGGVYSARHNLPVEILTPL